MLQADLDLYSAVFDGIEAGLIVLGPDRRIRAWNNWMRTAAGISAADALGRPIREVFPEAGSRLETAVAEALQFGVSSVVSSSLHPALLPLQTPSGRRLIHNVTVRPLPGESLCCLVQVSDVTVATDREKLLRERQNARYDAVVNSAPDAILTVDEEGVIQLANPAAAKELGYPPQELIGRPILAIFGDPQGWDAVWAELWHGRPLSRRRELMARRKNGSITFVEISAARWQSESRFFVTAILRNVDERRAAEAALRRLNETLERRVAERTAERDRMWRLSSDVMLVARPDGTITSTNPAWQDLLGWEEKNLLGARLHDFVTAEEKPKVDTIFAEMSRTRSRRLFELAMRARDGATQQVAWNAVSVDGLIQAVGRDMTAERAAQAALVKAEEALRQSQKMEALGQLTGGIAHDFNNLLSGIIGTMDLLKLRLAAHRTDGVERLANIAIESAERAAALTQRLLAFARRQPLDPRPVEINQLIRGMQDLLLRSLGEQARLEVRLGEPIWPALVDANQLENALLNLAINARDAMPGGGRLVIATEAASIEPGEGEDLQPGDYTVISVGDTGIGMSSDVLARVFDPFFTTKPIGVGTGLGLSMIYGFVKQSRGQIRIDSEPGHGTTVRIYLPRYDGAIAPRSRKGSGAAPSRGGGETVLVVEDDPAIRLLIGEVLQQFGYASLEAGDGQAALGLLSSDHRLDLMITDVGLPGIDGRQLADMARARRPELKVLFLTAYSQHATARSEFLLPGSDMMLKPFAIADLGRKIRQMIDLEWA